MTDTPKATYNPFQVIVAVAPQQSLTFTTNCRDAAELAHTSISPN